MLKRYMFFLLSALSIPGLCFAAKTKTSASSMDKTMAARQRKIIASPYEKNRLELIKPVKSGELLLRPPAGFSEQRPLQTGLSTRHIICKLIWRFLV